MGLLHASCAARDDEGVLLLGPPGSGKSDLLLRLLDAGFEMVGDDCVEVSDGWARPAATLAGLIEVRGLGIVRLPYRHEVRLTLVVELAEAERLPSPARHEALDLPLVAIAPFTCSAPQRVRLAMDCAAGRVTQVAGAFLA